MRHGQIPEYAFGFYDDPRQLMLILIVLLILAPAGIWAWNHLSERLEK